MRLDCVVGARPNFVKIAPLTAEMDRKGVDYRLIHTGQHYDFDMDGLFFEELAIPEPHLNLAVGSGTHAEQTAQAMVRLEAAFLDNRPDLVLVVGDVNSTLAGALAAAKLGIPVAHVEAGYRSFDTSMPEEINRILVDRIAQALFAPTEDAVENLLREGVDKNKVFMVGNVMAEALLNNLHAIGKRQTNRRFGLERRRYAVATVHRPENTDDESKLGEILKALSAAPLPVVMPIHPRTRKRLAESKDKHGLNNSLITTEPLSYLDMMSLLSEARLALTDSGGLQEESCLLQVPCVTIRDSTERTITVAVGANRLVPGRKDSILEAIDVVIGEDNAGWRAPALWDVRVSERVMAILMDVYGNRNLAVEGRDPADLKRPAA